MQLLLCHQILQNLNLQIGSWKISPGYLMCKRIMSLILSMVPTDNLTATCSIRLDSDPFYYTSYNLTTLNVWLFSGQAKETPKSLHILQYSLCLKSLLLNYLVNSFFPLQRFLTPPGAVRGFPFFVAKVFNSHIFYNFVMKLLLVRLKAQGVLRSQLDSSLLPWAKSGVWLIVNERLQKQWMSH